MNDYEITAHEDALRWYWTEGPGKFDLLNRRPGDPPLVASGRQIHEAMQRTMTQAEWRKFKEGVVTKLYGGKTPDGYTPALVKITPLKEKEQKVAQSNRSRKEVALARLKELEKELAFLARFPEDSFPEHTVLMTWKTYTKEVPTQRALNGAWMCEKQDFTYTYVLLKANGQWWMTGQNGHQINGASWDKVIEFVDEDDMIDVRTGKSIMLDATQEPVKTDPVDVVAAKADTPKAYLPQIERTKPIYDDRA